MTPSLTLSSSLGLLGHALVLLAAIAGIVLIWVFAPRLGGASASLGIIGCVCLIAEPIVGTLIGLRLIRYSYSDFSTILAVSSIASLLRNLGTVMLVIALLLAARRRFAPVPQQPVMMPVWPVQQVAPPQPTVPGLTWPVVPTEQPDPSTGSQPAGPAH